MINFDSILSAFDGKPTLLQWLKLVKKALDESVLKDITLKQDGANVVFTFNFEDGTSISTPAVTLPKGDTGAKGDKGDKGDKGESGGKLHKYVAALKIQDYAQFYYTFYDTISLSKADIPQYLNTHTKQCETVTTAALSIERPNTLVLGFWCDFGSTLLSCQTIENGVMSQTTPCIEELPTCVGLRVTEL